MVFQLGRDIFDVSSRHGQHELWAAPSRNLLLYWHAAFSGAVKNAKAQIMCRKNNIFIPFLDGHSPECFIIQTELLLIELQYIRRFIKCDCCKTFSSNAIDWIQNSNFLVNIPLLRRIINQIQIIIHQIWWIFTQNFNEYVLGWSNSLNRKIPI